MNKKGDVPTILLFIITLVLAITALFSFVSFSKGFAQSSEGVDEMLSNTGFYQEYVIEKAKVIGQKTIVFGAIGADGLGGKFQEIAEEENLGVLQASGFFEKIKAGEFEFKKEREEYVFNIKDLVIETKSGANSFRRNFGFQVYFDSNGKVIKSIKVQKD